MAYPHSTLRETSHASNHQNPREVNSDEEDIELLELERSRCNADEALDTYSPSSQEFDEEAEHRLKVLSWKKRRWWKRPSPIWVLIHVPLFFICSSIAIGPSIEIYTNLACHRHKPEFFLGSVASCGSVCSEVPVAGAYSSEPVSWREISPPNDTVLEIRVEDGDNTVQQRCASDPDVQAAVAQLLAAMSTSMGVLSCLTSAWWGSLSDRYGRTRLMCLAVTGLVALDINFLIVNLFADRLPGGYWFLIIGPLIDGCVGGVAFADASIQAYLSDCVDRNSRSRVFALSLGLASAGGAVGPIIGAFLLRFTQQPLSAYYLIALIHVVQMLMLSLAPESLSYSQMAAARLQHAERQRVVSRDEQRSGKLNMLLVRFSTCLRTIKHQNPFSALMPAVSKVNSIKKWSNDWSLCLVAGSYGLMILVDESYLYQYQFAAAAFGWSSEAINVNVSLWGGVRALHLVVLLPAIIKLLKPKLSSPSIDAQTINSSSLTPTSLAKPHNLRSAASFDLALSRISLFVLILAYLIIALDGTPWAFNTFTVLGALSSGFLPAVQSIALELHANRTSGREESGKLLGVLSLVRALGSQIIGPAFYGFTYLKTVAIFPRAIFVVSTIIVGIGFVLLIFVKVPKESSTIQSEEDSELDANEALLEEQHHDDGDDGDGRGVFAL